jgi:hypothetical protein
MAKKTLTKTSKSKKLDIKDVLKAVDARNYDFYDSLDDEQKKGFSPYVLMRFISNIQGDRDMEEWFLTRTNEFVNKDHWTLSKNHKPLLWKLSAAVGAGAPAFHPYVPALKLELNKIEKLLAEIHPSMKTEDIKLLASMMTEEDKEELFEKMGFDDEQRKPYQ